MRWFLILLMALSGGMPVASAAPAQLTRALESITADDLAQRTRILSSDEFEGRAPGSPAEERVVKHLVESFQQMGLEPGTPDGSWFQEVPLVGIKSEATARVTFKGESEDWQFPQDFVGWSPWIRERVEVRDSELVFVGYGVEAPEFGWDDYKGVDVRGKTLVMLVNDPPVPDPARPGELDPAVFRGKAMTYYGRWTYKYEIAAAKGATAAIIIHETGPAGYPYFVVINSWGRENYELKSSDQNTNRVAVGAWMSLNRAQKLLSLTGHDLAALKKRAIQRDFRPIPLGATIDFTVDNTLREFRSRNVVAKWTGRHPERRNEYVIYTAHWDHLGKDERLEGDQIFNGALDNASGTAMFLEIAEAFTRLPERPDRSILFLAVTAEEAGLLGARYYAENPLYPLTRTLANINIDGANVIGRSRNVGVIGHGLSTLQDTLAEAAQVQGRIIVPEQSPEKGFYYRSDHFEFAKVGVPALYLGAGGDDIIGKPPGYGRQRREEYTDADYHKVSDEMKPWWDFSGAVEDAQLLFMVGHRVASDDAWPEWNPGAEFKARRDAMLSRENSSETK